MDPPDRPISIFNSCELEQFRHAGRIDPEQIRALKTASLKKFHAADSLLATFPSCRDIAVPTLELVDRCDSQIDGASKLILKTREGLLVETVILRIATGRSTVCISSQVGCAAACEFCATGRMGVAHNLTVDEILGQVVVAGRLLAAEQRQLRNVVFMGMGEPLHNEAPVFASLRLLTAQDYFNLTPRRVLVSTVGIADGMVRLAERFPGIGLALSLHSVRAEIRERLIPLARRYPLAELRSSIQSANNLQDRPVMIEYLMLQGLTDTDVDGDLLIEWLHGLDVHVNLIPYNEVEGTSPRLMASEPSVAAEFAGKLKRAGIGTTVRHSLGRDIAAACGQLVQRENRRIAQQLAVMNLG